MLRECQLDFSIQCAKMEGPAAWRRSSVAGNAANELLQRRALPALSVKLPLTPGSGLQPGDAVVYVRALQPAGAFAKPPRPAKAPAAAAASLAAPTLERQDTPPQLREQPAKRSRVCGEAAALPPVQLARAASAPAGHLIAPGRSATPVVISMPPSAASSRSQSATSTPQTAPTAADSPLVALMRRVKGMLSPAPQPAAIRTY